MTNKIDCFFCNEETLKSKLKGFPCKTCIYEDNICYAILDLEQYTPYHTLVILNNHRIDISDSLTDEEMLGFMRAINIICNKLKSNARNENGDKPERIYVCSLCDGEEHLHAHLIPRYPFDNKDISAFRDHFLNRDGEESINNLINKRKLGGYWYIADRERATSFRQHSIEKRCKILESYADKIRIK